MKYIIGIFTCALVAVGVGYALWAQPAQPEAITDSLTTVANTQADTDSSEIETFVMYKSPLCGCCEGHADALRQEGYTVEIRPTQDMSIIKSQQGIPVDGESCHTTVVGEYVIEGHVPLAAIEKLLTEKPDIAGIGLAGMPAGTPGMPGVQTHPYEIYQISHSGEVSSYIDL